MNRFTFFWSSALVFGATLFTSVHPAQAATLFSEDFETGASGWSTDGLWHVQTNPEDISISADLNPALVSLPDDGSLPAAYSGSAVMWYGAEADGTFMGDDNDTTQWDKNGGWSDAAHSGILLSPQIDLTDQTQAVLSFWTWWEIEGVDADKYDLMGVQISTDGGSTFTDLGNGTINPLNDVDGEAWKPYSSGGLGQVGEWNQQVFDLSDFVGQTVQLKFSFDTMDEKYNAFRGWLIDDVQINTDSLPGPTWKYPAQAIRYCSSDLVEGQAPAEFHLTSAQTVKVTKSADAFAYITPLGSSDWVWDSSVGDGVHLQPGSYLVWVDFKGSTGCPHDHIQAKVVVKAGSQNSAVQPGEVLVLNGSHFVGGATVSFQQAKISIPADTVSVVSQHELDVVVPSSLDDGKYAVVVTNPDGQAKKMKKAITVTSENAPLISAISPESVGNAHDKDITITGLYFNLGAVVSVSGVPLTNVAVNEFGTTITGILPAGSSLGFHNVTVLNTDGQDDVLVGALEVTDGGAAPFIPNGSFVGVPEKVTGVSVTNADTARVEVMWTTTERATSYTLQLKTKAGDRVKSFAVKATTRRIGAKFLDSGSQYTLRVRAINSYGKGDWSDYSTFTAL